MQAVTCILSIWNSQKTHALPLAPPPPRDAAESVGGGSGSSVCTPPNERALGDMGVRELSMKVRQARDETDAEGVIMVVETAEERTGGDQQVEEGRERKGAQGRTVTARGGSGVGAEGGEGVRMGSARGQVKKKGINRWVQSKREQLLHDVTTENAGGGWSGVAAGVTHTHSTHDTHTHT